MTSFVTGGSGFLGTHLIKTLVDEGETVKALTRSQESAETVLEHGAKPVEGDLSDVEAMIEGMEGSDVVFHAAATVDQWGEKEKFEKVNVEGTKNVIEAASRANVDRLIHVSTEAVLANWSSMSELDESHPIPDSPIGLYPWSKALAEKHVRKANSEDITTVVVRPRFVWGAGDTSLLPGFVEAIENDDYMWIDSGRYDTSTCHVRNAVEGLLLAAEKGKGGEVYFVTDGEYVEFREFITKLVGTQGVEPGNSNVPFWLAKLFSKVSEWGYRNLPLKGEPSVTRSLVCLMGQEVTIDDSKAREELGYEEVISIEEGLKELEDYTVR